MLVLIDISLNFLLLENEVLIIDITFIYYDEDFILKSYYLMIVILQCAAGRLSRPTGHQVLGSPPDPQPSGPQPAPKSEDVASSRPMQEV